MHHITIIAGGIGSGKSMVARLLKVMGYDTYDCDARARQLMNDDDAMRRDITALLGPEAYDAHNKLRREYVARQIFGNDDIRTRLNAIVHPAVRADAARWADARQRCFVETALLDESGLDALATDVWHVVAPTEVRIARVVERNAATRQQVLQRIAAQNDNLQCKLPVYNLVNDGVKPLIAQVMALLDN